MSLEERYRIFGDRSETLAQEGVFIFFEENHGWPLWDDALDSLEAFKEVTSREDAESRLNAAIAAEEVGVRAIGGGADFFVTLSRQARDRIMRRHMDRRMPRQDREETF